MPSLISRAASVMLSTFVLTSLPVPSEAAKYTCNAADRMSKLGAKDADKVVVTPDERNKECRFSVNGEPSGSPPRALIIQAINLISAAKASGELMAGRVDWLGNLLLAASPETAVSEELRGQLSRNASGFVKCFEALEKNASSNFPNFQTGDALCRLVPAGGDVGFGSKLSIGIESGVPLVVLAVKQSSSAGFLVIPFRDFRQPPLQ